MTDFFISYTSVDKQWAEWIGYILEEERYSVILQAWDFRPGSNFVLEMQEAAKKATRTIMVLSPDYMKSQFASPEWAAAFARDPQGLGRKLVPVIVGACEPDGLLGQIVHISLISLDQEAARKELVSGIKADRAKPSSRPAFPGVTLAPNKTFPGSKTLETIEASPYMPKVKRKPSDMERRRFIKDSFTTIQNYFESALRALGQQVRNLESDFQAVSATEFTAEVFLNGDTVTACRIRYGSDVMSRDGITYAEGRGLTASSGVNEILSIANGDGEPTLSSMMGSFNFNRQELPFDASSMTPSQAAEFLWRRFIARLEY